VISASHWEDNDVQAVYALWRDFAEGLNNDFYTYKLDWTPTRMVTYVDDQMIWQICITFEEGLSRDPQFLLFNLAMGGLFITPTVGSGLSSSSAGGSSSAGYGECSSGGCGEARTEVTAAPLPATMLVFWVRIYDKMVIRSSRLHNWIPRANYSPCYSVNGSVYL
jgi:beta-glucanase (GH16 family)